jgi:hypothetical protein
VTRVYLRDTRQDMHVRNDIKTKPESTTEGHDAKRTIR